MHYPPIFEGIKNSRASRQAPGIDLPISPITRPRYHHSQQDIHPGMWVWGGKNLVSHSCKRANPERFPAFFPGRHGRSSSSARISRFELKVVLKLYPSLPPGLYPAIHLFEKMDARVSPRIRFPNSIQLPPAIPFHGLRADVLDRHHMLVPSRYRHDDAWVERPRS